MYYLQLNTSIVTAPERTMRNGTIRPAATVTLTVARETEKAVQIAMTSGEDVAVEWLPKSQITVGAAAIVFHAHWVAEKMKGAFPHKEDPFGFGCPSIGYRFPDSANMSDVEEFAHRTLADTGTVTQEQIDAHFAPAAVAVAPANITPPAHHCFIGPMLPVDMSPRRVFVEELLTARPAFVGPKMPESPLPTLGVETVAVEIVSSPSPLCLPTKKQATATAKGCRAYSKNIKASARRATKAQKESARQTKRTARAIGIANTATRRYAVKLLKAWIRAEKETARIQAAAAKAEREAAKKAASATKPAKAKKIAAEPIHVAVETETADFWEVVLR